MLPLTFDTPALEELYDCKIFDEERDRLKSAVMRTDNWPISKNNLIKKFYKDFAKFTNIINFDKM